MTEIAQGLFEAVAIALFEEPEGPLFGDAVSFGQLDSSTAVWVLRVPGHVGSASLLPPGSAIS